MLLDINMESIANLPDATVAESLDGMFLPDVLDSTDPSLPNQFVFEFSGIDDETKELLALMLARVDVDQDARRVVLYSYETAERRVHAGYTVLMGAATAGVATLAVYIDGASEAPTTFRFDGFSVLRVRHLRWPRAACAGDGLAYVRVTAQYGAVS